MNNYMIYFLKSGDEGKLRKALDKLGIDSQEMMPKTSGKFYCMKAMGDTNMLPRQLSAALRAEGLVGVLAQDEGQALKDSKDKGLGELDRGIDYSRLPETKRLDVLKAQDALRHINSKLMMDASLIDDGSPDSIEVANYEEFMNQLTNGFLTDSELTANEDEIIDMIYQVADECAAKNMLPEPPDDSNVLSHYSEFVSAAYSINFAALVKRELFKKFPAQAA